jgi:uncharacterized membrane protein YuzA (DUF378 family)
MVSWGVTLAVIGALSFVLPLIGVQHILISIFGAHERIAAVAFIVVGLAMMAMGYNSRK